MPLEDIYKKIDELTFGQQFKVKYKLDSIDAVKHLVELANAHVVDVQREQWITILNLVLVGYWSDDDLREITMSVGSSWNRDWFTDRVVHEIEAIELVKPE